MKAVGKPLTAIGQRLAIALWFRITGNSSADETNRLGIGPGYQPMPLYQWSLQDGKITSARYRLFG
ncbi:MAG TPA: hypothetical protein DCR55_07710 [Lentisphaeria bacterium]|nr:hypothetical protein [Lentisphaeria bacterium]